MTLTDHIEQDLARCITRTHALPCELKLEALAAHYGSSTQPVRLALQRLRKRGLLKPGSIEKLPIKPPKADHETKNSPETSQREKLLQKIIDDLIQKSYLGDAMFLRETHMAKRYGVSTTIVREIFSKLVGLRLLDHVPRRGWRVRPLTQKDLDDFIRVRVSLETLALELAWEKLDLAKIKAALDGNQQPTATRKTVMIDNDFHQLFIETADNFYIRDFFDRHGSYFQMLFAWEGHDRTANTQTVRQHRAILQAILDKNLPKAKEALRRHITDNHPVLTRILSARNVSEAKTTRR